MNGWGRWLFFLIGWLWRVPAVHFPSCSVVLALRPTSFWPFERGPPHTDPFTMIGSGGFNLVVPELSNQHNRVGFWWAKAGSCSCSKSSSFFSWISFFWIALIHLRLEKMIDVFVKWEGIVHHHKIQKKALIWTVRASPDIPSSTWIHPPMRTTSD